MLTSSNYIFNYLILQVVNKQSCILRTQKYFYKPFCTKVCNSVMEKDFFFNFKYCNKDLKATSLYVFSIKAFIFFRLNIYIIPVP